MSVAEAIARVLPTIVAVTAVWAYEILFPLGPAMIAAAIAVDIWRWRWLSRRPPTPLSRRAVRMPELVILFLYLGVFGTLALAIQVDAAGGRACLPELQAQIGTIFNTAHRQLLRTGGFCDGPLAAPTFVMLVLTPVCLVVYTSWKAVVYNRDPNGAVEKKVLPLTILKTGPVTGIVVFLLIISFAFISIQKIPYLVEEEHVFKPADRVDGLLLSMLILLFSFFSMHSILWADARQQGAKHV